VKANHQQGRDTHLRQIKIYSPIESKPVSTCDVDYWATKEFHQFANIR
jgi:anaphase-promoting complex subunit 10